VCGFPKARMPRPRGRPRAPSTMADVRYFADAACTATGLGAYGFPPIAFEMSAIAF